MKNSVPHLATFQMFNNYMWLVATVFGSAGLDWHNAKCYWTAPAQGHPLWNKSGLLICGLLHFFQIILKMTNFAETF